MEIWAWVESLEKELREAGQDRIADMLYDIPNDLHNHRISQVEAVMPEALAAARAIKNPWLEVFFRHWGLHSRLCNQAEGEAALPETIALMEFAHREETIHCPQTICVTNDLSSCYGNIDGPGWAPERLDVCNEAFGRIDPSWACYDCISREYAATLIDMDRPAEAIPYLEEQAIKMRKAGNNPGVAYQELQAVALHKNGQSEDALALLKKIGDANQDDDDDGDRTSRATRRARILAEMGRFDEAWEEIPSWSEMVPNLYNNWTAAIALIAQNRSENGGNSWQLGSIFQQALDHMIKVGAHRDTIDLAERHARLALHRGSAWTARRALAIAQATLHKLRAPCGADQTIKDLATDIAHLPTVAQLPVPAEQLLDYLAEQGGDDRNPEKEIDWLLAACATHPDDEALCAMTASAMNACRAADEAQSFLWRFVEKHPELNGRPFFQLLDTLLEHDQDADIIRLASTVEHSQPDLAFWCRARLAHKRARWQEVGDHVQSLLALTPDAQMPRRLWADAAMNMDDFATAIRLRQELTDLAEEPNDDLWDLMTAASAAQQWDIVRTAAARLKMELTDSDGPVEEEWGWVRLRYYEDGEWREYFGQRTGPVTARVRSIASPSNPQHVRDWVVFDATPLEQPPEDEEERKGFTTPYRVVQTLQRAHYSSWFVDGAFPGDDVFDAFVETLNARDWSLWVNSSSDYTVRNPAAPDGERLPGVYFFLAAPANVPAADIDAFLTHATKDWKHPLCWLHLVRAAGKPDTAHLKVIEDYDL